MFNNIILFSCNKNEIEDLGKMFIFIKIDLIWIVLNDWNIRFL